ncbi:MAG: hypothetical protein APF81_26025 [Desulfosporosinus sp. BRH_c37]|nr:MAG: hypothetical protein APF81_26025 [Desulfosporosinus sp. BRH_c37]
MRIYISIKQAGKRQDYITKKELVLAKVPLTLRELIAEIVHINTVEYNSKASEPWIMKYLASEEIENQAETGKVGFGDRKTSELVQLKLNIESSVGDSTPTEAGYGDPLPLKEVGVLRLDHQANVTKAIATALLAFQDGIYRVFIGDNEVAELDEKLSLKEGEVLTFIRFTMLAGRMW